MKSLLGAIVSFLVIVAFISVFMNPSSQKKEYRAEVMDIHNGISKVRFYEVEPAFKTHNPNDTTLVKAKVIKDKGGVEVEYEGITYKVNDKSLIGKLGEYVDISLNLQDSRFIQVNKVLEKGKLYTFTSDIHNNNIVVGNLNGLPVIDVNTVEVTLPQPPETACFVKGEMGTFKLVNDPNTNSKFFYYKIPTAFVERGVYLQVSDDRGSEVSLIKDTHYSELANLCNREEVDYGVRGKASSNLSEIFYHIGL